MTTQSGAGKEPIRCDQCQNILAWELAGHLYMNIGLRNGRRREVMGDLRFPVAITCENCGHVWHGSGASPSVGAPPPVAPVAPRAT